MNMMSDGMSFECKSISNFYWSARISCCLHKSTAQALLRKYNSCNGKAVHGLHFSHSNRSNMIALFRNPVVWVLLVIYIHFDTCRLPTNTVFWYMSSATLYIIYMYGLMVNVDCRHYGIYRAVY